VWQSEWETGLALVHTQTRIHTHTTHTYLGVAEDELANKYRAGLGVCLGQARALEGNGGSVLNAIERRFAQRTERSGPRC
jgi:hypothetical protein